MYNGTLTYTTDTVIIFLRIFHMWKVINPWFQSFAKFLAKGLLVMMGCLMVALYFNDWLGTNNSQDWVDIELIAFGLPCLWLILEIVSGLYRAIVR